MSRLMLSCAIAAIVATSAAARAEDFPSRTVVRILLFSQRADVMQRLQEWTDAFTVAVSPFLSNSKAGPQLRRSDKIKVKVTRDHKAQPSNEELRNVWDQELAIEVVLAVGHMDDNTTTVVATVCLGDFHGKLPQNFPISVAIRNEQYQANHDLVVAVMLYALSVDAKNDKATSCDLLREARSTTAGIDDASAITGLTELRSAINSSIEERQCPVVVN